MSKQQLSDNQQKVKAYLEKYHIEEIISDMINTISHVQMPDPIIFMINFLAQFHVDKEELIKHGITVSSSNMPKPILFIPYPQFPPNCQNLLKQTLQNKELFFLCKNNYTRLNFLLYRKFQEQFQTTHKIEFRELQAQDCYESFEPLFKSVIEQHNKTIDLEFKYLKHYQPQKDHLKIFEDTTPFVEECIIKMKRNIDSIQFNSTLSDTQRAQLNKKIQIFLKTQNIIKFSSFINIVDMNLDEAKKLLSLSDKLFKTDSSQAIGLCTYLAGKKKGPRFPDWPKNRSIAIASDKNAVVWINKEDHLQLKTFSGKQSNLEKALSKVFQVNQVLEENLSLAFSEKYGYLNVKPQDSGIGISLTFKLKINPNDIQKFKMNAQSYKKSNNPWFSIKDHSKEGTKWVIQLLRNASLNKGDLIFQLSILLQTLFEDIVSTPQQQTINQQLYDYEQPIEHFDFYEENHEEILKQTKRIANDKFLPNELINDNDDDVIYYNDILITGRYFIARRNIFQKSTPQIRDQLLRSTLHREIHENAGKWITHAQNDYQQIVSKFFNDIEYKVNFLGTSFFISNNQKLIALSNVDDHFIIFHKIENFSISQSMVPLVDVLNSLEQTVMTNGYSFAELSQIGYLTKQIKNSGSAISIHLTFKDSLITTNYQDRGLTFTSSTSLTLNSIGPRMLPQFCESFNEFLNPSKRNLVTYLCFPLANSQIQMKEVAGLYSEEVPELQDQSILNSKVHKGITLLDCWRDHKLWAPDVFCFDVFRPLYESYTTKFFPILQRYDHRIFKNTELEYVRNLKLDVQENMNLETSFMICRNFEKYRFCHFMNDKQLKQLRHAMDIYLTKTEGFDIIGDVYNQNFIDIYVGLKHHISIKISCHVRFILDCLTKVYEILDRLNKFMAISKSVEFGYFGPYLQESVFSGLQSELKFPYNHSMMKKLESLIKDFQYTLTKDNHKCIIKTDRPGVLQAEIKIIEVKTKIKIPQILN